MTHLSPHAQKNVDRAATRERLWWPALDIEAGQLRYHHPVSGSEKDRRAAAARLIGSGWTWDGHPDARYFYRPFTEEALGTELKIHRVTPGRLDVFCRLSQAVRECLNAQKEEEKARRQATRQRDKAIPVHYPQGRNKLFKT